MNEHEVYAKLYGIDVMREIPHYKKQIERTVIEGFKEAWKTKGAFDK